MDAVNLLQSKSRFCQWVTEKLRNHQQFIVYVDMREAILERDRSGFRGYFIAIFNADETWEVQANQQTLLVKIGSSNSNNDCTWDLWFWG